MEEREPTSWWIFRDLEGTALDVSDEQPVTGILQETNGVWIGKVSRPHPDRYEILKKEKLYVDKIADTGSVNHWVLAATIHRITKPQYETYLEFGMFDVA